ncbi:hypothetical protein [Leyella stercorea]|uniref:hypothetical protein n=1 Tax=Leyella stercorea TaxID=363265 RepID=UPI002431E4AB|nr:hypothetical protein [Leyella stercorea]
MHLLKLYIMSALLNAIGSTAQSLASGALSSLIGGKISSGISKDMMRYQDKLNDQNALDAYNRQRALMGDAALLQKQGMLKAGYNTAFGSNGSVMSAGSALMSNVGQSGAGSNNMPNSFQTLLDSKNVEANVTNANANATNANANARLADSKKEGQDIENTYKAADAISTISNKAADTRDKNARAHLNEITNNLLRKYGDRQEAAKTGRMESEESEAASRAALTDLHRQLQQVLNPVQLAQAEKNLELLGWQIETEKEKPNVMRSEENKNYASASMSWAQSALADSQTLAQDIQNAINGDDRVVKAAVNRLINAAREAGPQSFNEYAWSVFNDPNATTGQKWKAGFASILGWVERSLGGDSSRLPGQVYDDLKTAATRAGKGIREKFRSKPGKNRVPVWRR